MGEVVMGKEKSLELSEERTREGKMKVNFAKLAVSGLVGAVLGVGAYLFFESLDDEVKEAIRLKLKRSTIQFLKQVLSLDDLDLPETSKTRKALPDGEEV